MHHLRLAFLFLLLVLPGLSPRMAGQQHGYLIENHLPSAYQGYDQVWHTVQDKNGLLFFGGTSEVFCFDGQNWEHIAVKPGAACRNLYYDARNDVVYVGSVGDFGYLNRRANGSYYYESLCKGLPEKQKAFTDIWKVNACGGFIYFQAAERIFAVKDKKITAVIEAGTTTTFALSFTANERLFVRQRNVGLMEISGSSLVPVPGCSRFATERLLGILAEKTGSLLLLTGDHGIMRYSPATKVLDTIPCISDDFLLHAGVLGCIYANDTTIAVCSRTGIAFYTLAGKLISSVNKKSGLSDETVSAIFTDNYKNIWATHNYGISRITFNSPVHIYNSQAGFEGSLISIGYANSILYFTTTEGIYAAREPESSITPLSFQKISGIQTEIWEIIPAGNDLLLCSSAGLLLIRNQQQQFITHTYTNCLRQIPGTENRYLVIEKGGIAIVERDQAGQYSVMQQFDLGAEEIVRVSAPQPVNTSNDTYTLWGSNRFKEGLRIELGLKTNTIHVRKFSPQNGFPEKDFYPVIINDSIFFIHNHSAIRYLPGKDNNQNAVCFAPAPDLFTQFYSNTKLHIMPPADPGMMLEPLDGKPEIFFGNFGNTVNYLPYPLSSMPDKSAVNQSLLTSKYIWTVSATTIMSVRHYNATPTADKSFTAMVRKVIVGKDSLLSANVTLRNYTFSEPISYSLRDITFHFSSPSIEFISEMNFKCKLEGFDTAWFNTGSLTFKSYTNLPEGNYTFLVQAISATGKVSENAVFHFVILPPWYRTGWAYAGYIVILGILIALTAKFSAARLRKQKQRLEQVVEQRTAEVQQQKKLLEAQKTELETAYTDIRDSIHYARRIQSAILPLESDLRNLFGEFFVFYQPQDIVSGDFYWCAEHQGLKFLACVDCTGHGVPGAFMSMIGNTLLNHLILERGLTQPHEILEQLHTEVRHALKQDSVGETKDGMDVALIVTDAHHNLHYAGANRALWYIRNGVLHEIKPVKRAIAGDTHAAPAAFVSHTLALEPHDCIYLSTDGFADQFGGERGKKFMVKHFHELLLKLHKLPMHEQQTIITQTFNQWKGNLQQVDDVLVLGLKVEY
jgi:serine phosphatase RsbU (regulator of sigma subunit)